jgi:hypothetical protein
MDYRYLTDDELVSKHRISQEVIDLVREYTSAECYETEFNLDYPYLDKKEKVPAMHPKKSFSMRVKGLTTKELLKELYEPLQDLSYQIFLSEAGFGFDDDEVTIFASVDQYDILRMRASNAVNFDLYTVDLIHKLKEWSQLCTFRITAAGFDSVGLQFFELPKDLDAFVKDVHAFCPDVVDQGTGSIKQLTKELGSSKLLWLWWD